MVFPFSDIVHTSMLVIKHNIIEIIFISKDVKVGILLLRSSSEQILFKDSFDFIIKIWFIA